MSDSAREAARPGEVRASDEGPGPRLYNSRIFRNYIEFLRARYPSVDVEEILGHAGITMHEVNDPRVWLRQDQANRFHEILDARTGNPYISREAGRFLFSSRGMAGVKRAVFGLLRPNQAYALVPRFIGMMTRATTVEIVSQGSSRVELKSTPLPGVREERFQCENRKGSFEAIATHFTGEYAQVEEFSCFHDGADCCHYGVSWRPSRFERWVPVRNILLALAVVGCGAAFPLLPIVAWSLLTLGTLGAVGLVFYLVARLRIRELTRVIDNQGDTTNELMTELRARHDNAMLGQKIGEAVSSTVDIGRLLEAAVEVLQDRLQFDRGGIQLVDEDDSLTYQAWFTGQQPQGVAFQVVRDHVLHSRKMLLLNDPAEIDRWFAGRD